ncbi:MAG: hypothetical protein Tsb0013_23870 [Phycisphaerales bacterium]
MADHEHAPLTFPKRPEFSPGTHAHDGHEDDSAVFDAIADMFLGPDPSRERAPDPAHAPWSIELLVMGHLPVRARPWASQYAAVRAEEEGCSIALVRIGNGYGSVELFGSARGSLSVAAAPSLAGAIERARQLASCCLVQLDDEAQSELLRRGELDAVTIIVGANDAAVVDAYREIKSIAQRMTEDLPVLRVGVMGADDDRADGVVEKLVEAADRFLGQRIESTTAIHRMGPTGAVSLFGDRIEMTADSAIALLLGDMPEPLSPTVTDHRSPLPPPVEIKPALPDAPPGVHAAADTQTSSGASSSAGVRFLHDDIPPLIDCVGSLDALDVACPYDPEAVLAVDRSGALVILRDASDQGEALLMTLDWGEAHRSILARATNGRVRADLEVVAHAFVRDTSGAVDLREAYGDRLRVHLLTPIPAGARWMVTPG